MKILFVTKDLNLSAPLGPMYLSSIAKKNGHFVDLLCAKREDIEKSVNGLNPDIAAYSFTSGEADYYLNVNKKIKKAKPDIFSCFGGPHATFFPEMIKEDGVDAVCIGEGEEAFTDLITKMEAGVELNDIKNWWVKRDGIVYKNDVRPLIEDIDTIPFPDRDLFYSKDDFLKKSKVLVFIGGRGCPYNCSYCFNHSYYEIYKNKGKRIRLRMPEMIAEEVNDAMSKYPLQLVIFTDDILVANKEWFEKFAFIYKEKVGLPFVCNVRANHMDEDIARLLKEAGCFSVLMGVESGSHNIRSSVLNRHMENETILKAAELLHKYSIKFQAQNILGIPGSSFEDDMETFRLNLKCRPTRAQASLCIPYPKTALWDFAVKNKYFDGDLAKIKRSIFISSSAFNFDYSHKKKTERLRALFILCLYFPILSKAVPLLVRLPLLKFYILIDRIIHGYTLSRVYPMRLSFGEYIKTVFRFFKRERLSST